MRFAGWPRPPFLLGLVLGPIAERYLWTSIQLYGGEFLLRPGVITIFILLVLVIFYPVLMRKLSIEKGNDVSG